MTSAQSLPPALIVGAKSDIGRALAHRLAGKGHPIVLAARDPEALLEDAADIGLRYDVDAKTIALDVTDTAALKPILAELDPKPHIIVCMVGWMGEQSEQEQNPDLAAKVIATNFSGPAALMEAGADLFSGIADDPTWLVGVSSVAGDRGRARNYYYGAAKAGFTAMLSGLRQRLAKSNTTVITVKPGFVATSATADLDLPGPLTASADDCAKMIERAIVKKREIVYPTIWRGIMSIIRSVPEPIFKRMSF